MASVNAMWNEGFGIGVVEYVVYQAAELVNVVEYMTSGGPKMDVVIQGAGVLRYDRRGVCRGLPEGS